MVVLCRIEAVCYHILQKAFHHCGLEQRITYIKQLQAELAPILSIRKDLDFLGKMITEHLKLLDFQKDISGIVKDQSCCDLSVYKLIRFCCLNNQMKQADRIRNTFKVPDKRFLFYFSVM